MPFVKFFLENQNIKQTILKNNFWLGLSELINKLLRLLPIIYTIRLLGAYRFGEFSLAFSFAMFFSVLADFGLNFLLIKKTAKNEPTSLETLNNIFWLKIILGLLTNLIIVIAALLSPYALIIKITILILSGFIFCDNLIQLFFFYFRSLQKVQYEALFKIINAVTMAVLVFVCLPLKISIVVVGAAYFFSSLLGLITLSFFFNYKFHPIKFIGNIHIWLNLLKSSLPLAAILAFNLIYHSLDSIILGSYKMNVANGWYNAVYKVMDALLIPALILAGVFFPVLCSIYDKNKQKLENPKIFKNYLSFSLAMAIPILLGSLIMSNRIISILYGQNYLPAQPAFTILLGVLFLIYLGTPFMYLLMATDLQKITIRIMAFGAILNLILNLIMIPHWSLIGAGIATLITYIFDCGLSIYFATKKLSLKIFDWEFWKSIIICLLVSLTLMFFSILIVKNNLSFILALFLSIFIYGFVFYRLYIKRKTF